VREDSDVFLRGARGQRRDLRHGLYGNFAGILQGKIRQRVCRVRMLMLVACEGIKRSRLAHDPGHTRQMKQHRLLSRAHRRDLRGRRVASQRGSWGADAMIKAER